MIAAITTRYLNTEIEFVITALVVCAVMAMTVVILMWRIRDMPRQHRLGGAAIVAVVTGVGVWTTHFVAMLGFRPDAAIGYDAGVTVVSALIGIALVGGPVAASCFVDRRLAKAGLGALAGAGVGAMHFLGMAALEGCTVAYNPWVVGASLIFGMACFAAVLPLGESRPAAVMKGVGIVSGICALHFTAMSGISVEIVGGQASAINGSLLSAFLAFASLALSMAAMMAIRAWRNMEASRRIAAAKEAAQNAAFATALRNMSNGLLMIDGDQRIMAINDRLLELLSLASGSVGPGDMFNDLLERVADPNAASDQRMAEAIRGHVSEVTRANMHRTEEHLDDGRAICIACRRMPDGGAVLTFDDVTKHRAAQAEITHLAYHDPLTGLLNRRSFRERVQTRLDNGSEVILLLMDLDRFKPVNDALGHAIGDALLVEVGETILSETAGIASVFRLGGDEIAILPQAVDDATIDACARRILDRIAEPFLIKGHTISIACSIGISRADAGDSPSQVLQKADLALYRAKEMGRNRIETYEEGMIEQVKKRRQMELDLSRALSEKQFELFYQPFFRLPEQEIIGFEALIRWNHPERGLVNPVDFIPLAEETGMIREIGSWVLEEACRQLAQWPGELYIAVNMSPIQLRSPAIVERVSQALAQNGVDASRLEIELTETAIAREGDALAETLKALRALGVRIAMDDFGTGYSSLTHLRDFNLDRIKIDRSFVDIAEGDVGSRAVTRAVTSMARDLSIKTTGEGVETAEQLAHLNQLGCNVAQGYHLGRPTSATDAAKLIMARSFERDRDTDAADAESQAEDTAKRRDAGGA